MAAIHILFLSDLYSLYYRLSTFLDLGSDLVCNRYKGMYCMDCWCALIYMWVSYEMEIWCFRGSGYFWKSSFVLVLVQKPVRDLARFLLFGSISDLVDLEFGFVGSWLVVWSLVF